jgi:hypothetical protein
MEIRCELARLRGTRQLVGAVIAGSTRNPCIDLDTPRGKAVPGQAAAHP